MHEYSIVQALLERVESEARARGATRVHRLSVRLGELSGVEAGLLATAYSFFRERTLCAEAAMDIEPVAARWSCRSCGAPIARPGPLRCGCGGEARLASGDEILLERIEMEVP